MHDDGVTVPCGLSEMYQFEDESKKNNNLKTLKLYKKSFKFMCKQSQLFPEMGHDVWLGAHA